MMKKNKKEVRWQHKLNRSVHGHEWKRNGKLNISNFFSLKPKQITEFFNVLGTKLVIFSR